MEGIDDVSAGTIVFSHVDNGGRVWGEKERDELGGGDVGGDGHFGGGSWGGERGVVGDGGGWGCVWESGME